MRLPLRLLPLSLSIAACLPGTALAASDKPLNWALCPVEDAVPLFPDAQPPTGSAGDREGLPTDIRGDQTVGVDQHPFLFHAGGVGRPRHFAERLHWAFLFAMNRPLIRATKRAQ